jgi:hypothetical protein
MHQEQKFPSWSWPSYTSGVYGDPSMIPGMFFIIPGGYKPYCFIYNFGQVKISSADNIDDGKRPDKNPEENYIVGYTLRILHPLG